MEWDLAKLHDRMAGVARTQPRIYTHRRAHHLIPNLAADRCCLDPLAAPLDHEGAHSLGLGRLHLCFRLPRGLGRVEEG